MSDSQTYATPVQLTVREIEVLLDEVAHRRCMWEYARTTQLLDRIERLISELRVQLGVQTVNEDFAELVGELVRWAVRTDPDFDRQPVRELTERLGLEYP
jgi:hypothetical protein